MCNMNQHMLVSGSTDKVHLSINQDKISFSVLVHLYFLRLTYSFPLLKYWNNNIVQLNVIFGLMEL